MSLREIRKTFTKSELFIVGWRAQEQYVQMKRKIKSPPKSPFQEEDTSTEMPNVPSRFYNEEGEIDLRKVSSKDAYKFFASQGIQLPIIDRR